VRDRATIREPDRPPCPSAWRMPLAVWRGTDRETVPTARTWGIRLPRRTARFRH